MRKFLLPLALVVLLAFAFVWSASAADPVAPTVTAVEPASAYNDIGTHVTITGADFAVDDSIDPAVTPSVRLGSTSLTDVTRVDTQTLTATVPWGMNAGVYDLAVTNPGGATATLTAAFEVKQGINSWNAGELDGADVRQLLMKVDDPDTLYALAYEVGLFRSEDAGETWHFTSANVIANSDFVLDPHHPDWLYCASFDGLRVSKDKGETWGTVLYPTEGDVTPRSWEVFVSPSVTDTLFLATYGDGTAPQYLGLQKSTDGGAHWVSVPSMEGTAVQNVAFDPTPGSHDMVLMTSDARVFRSADDGATWVPAPSPPGITSLGLRGYLMYNPFYEDRPGEVWLVSTEKDGGMFKSNAGLTSWTDVAPWDHAGFMPAFVGPDDVYVWRRHSTDGGTSWENFDPPPTWGYGDFVFSPENTRTIYFTDSTVGVMKTTDGGANWHDSNLGLTGMRCSSLAVSATDPLRVYAGFFGWSGVYISDDGTSHWRYVPIADSGGISQVLQDPFDPRLVYAVGGGFYRSTDGGETWPGGPWAPLLPPGAPSELMGFAGFAADPFQEGRLLTASRVGGSSVHDHDRGYLYSSDDRGASWQTVVVTGTAGSIGPIGDIEFDPEAPGTVYLTSDGGGVYKSADHGATWDRIDDPEQEMSSASNITIATDPQHALSVLTGGNGLYSSVDGGATWLTFGGAGFDNGIPVHSYTFVDADSTRLYASTYAGLYFSGDMGVTWTRSAGVLGGVHVTTLAHTEMDGHTILYAATTGGDTAAVWNPAAAAVANAPAHPGTSQMSVAAAAVAAPPSTMVDAGIYRRAQVETVATFYSSGTRDGWVLESSENSSRGGSTSSSGSTFRLGDSASKRQYRSVLSFSTGAGLPDGAVITGATLSFRRSGVTGGGDPVAKFGGFAVDVRRGYFSTKTTLQTGDFQASANKSLTVTRPGVAGGWYSIDLSGARTYINKTASGSGLTQLRLRFRTGDNNNRTANYLKLYSGDVVTSSRPRLRVTYYLP